MEGEYNIAIRVNEFRNGARIGYVVRDMQILIEDSDNNPPVAYVPQDTCISANDLYQERLFTNDPDFDRVQVDIYGGLLEEGAQLDETRVRNDSVVVDLQWTPDCDDIGRLPMVGLFKVEDNGDPNLSDNQTWLIQVNGPAPELTSVTESEDGFLIEWEPYECQLDFASIEVFRFECDTSNVQRSACTTGVPDEWGAIKIGEVDITQTSFEDIGAVAGLSSGTSYYYMIAVQFGIPSYGESYASNILSGTVNESLPIISTISFDKIANDQQINVAFLDPLDFDSTEYSYPLNFRISSDDQIISSSTTQTFDIDTVLFNELGFSYDSPWEISVFDNDGDLIGTQNGFSSEELEAQGSDESLLVNWTNDNPWIYSDTLYQYIYIFIPEGDTVLVDSVLGGETNYTLTDLSNGDSVCAYAELQYTYCVNGIDSSFKSFTNTSCAKIQDNVPPCTPVLEVGLIDCDDSDYEGNELSWFFEDEQLGCSSNDIAFYSLFVRDAGETTFNMLNDSLSNEALDFVDLSGAELMCYYLTATDSSGNVSAQSNIVCQDFCGDITYPNIITPNGDDLNDDLIPIGNISGVENSLLVVFNRWGTEIYRTSDVMNLPWDGFDPSGDGLSQSVYYIQYTANRIGGNQEQVEYKGWVTVVR